MAVPHPRDRHGLPTGQGVGVRSRSTRLALGRARAFTLLELVAVVSIIAICAALAIPSAVVQMRDRRVQEAARRIGMVYRQARMHALGRGSAVLVSFADGAVTVREARAGTGAGLGDDCADLPVSSCGIEWAVADNSREIDAYQLASSGESAMSLALTDSAEAPITTLDVCFTPMGRAFARTVAEGGFAINGSAYIATVSRTGVTRPRSIALMPNGSARLINP